MEYPQAFAQLGYEIEGWYTSEKLEEDQKWDFEKKVFLNTKLYAKWNEIS